MVDDGCKVCRVLERWGMEQYDDRVVEQWRGPPDERLGYRKLAEWLNVTMLERGMDRSGMNTLGEEAESKYRRLTGDDETTAREVREDLRERGVPIDDLLADFVSYGVVRTHLTECRGLTPEEREPSDWERDAIDIATDHASEKVSEAVGSLVSKGELEVLEDVDVEVDVTLECPSCHVRVPLDRALRRGRVCDCEPVEVE